MAHHKLSVAAATFLEVMTISAALAAKGPPADWEGLVAVKAKRFDAVSLMPGADFQSYTKVMFDPTEVALKKDWLRDYNQSVSRDLARRMDSSDVEKAFETIRTRFGDVFAKEYTAAGYQVVTAPGPDVLRMRTGVINLSVNSPDQFSSSHTRSISEEAGEATLVLEVRDSQSGALMGRVLDRRLAGDTSRLLRNAMTNRNDFSRLFKEWAKDSVAGLAELKNLSAEQIVASKK